MKLELHNIRVKAFAKEGEREGLMKALEGLLPGETSIEEEVLPAEEDSGIFTSKIIVLKALVKKKREVGQLAEKIFTGLEPDELRTLHDEVESRVDGDCNFYVRLSKEKLAGGRISLKSKDPVHVKMKVAAYPAKKEKAADIMKKILEEMING